MSTLAEQIACLERQKRLRVGLLDDMDGGLLDGVISSLRSLEAARSSLSPHAKWLRMVAAQLAIRCHPDWGNTCVQAADAIEGFTVKP